MQEVHAGATVQVDEEAVADNCVSLKLTAYVLLGTATITLRRP